MYFSLFSFQGVISGVFWIRYLYGTKAEKWFYFWCRIKKYKANPLRRLVSIFTTRHFSHSTLSPFLLHDVFGVSFTENEVSLESAPQNGVAKTRKFSRDVLFHLQKRYQGQSTTTANQVKNQPAHNVV